MITADDIDINYIDVMFEITRFCNMECPHCIRGDMQRKRIKKDYINQTLSQIENIGTIMFTGGEPGLAKDLIRYTLDACNHYRVDVQNFWMATNGTVTTPSFFKIIKDWVEYCDDGDITGLRVSIDPYHNYINKYPFIDFQDNLEYNGLNMYFEFEGAPKNSEYLIGEGRAADNYYTTRIVEHNLRLVDGHIEGHLYINAKGYLITTCDISYERMDNDQDFIVCHVSEDIKEGLAKWFNNHPEFVELEKEMEFA